MSESRKLHLYLHTHWHREWYLTHEEYRSQLFFVVEDLLRKLESGTLPSFFLDGQACLIEDVLEIEPAMAARIKQCVQAGQLEVGPWYVLADQMLVAGESLIRNLEMGLAVARLHGQAAAIGYCPDTFGHSQDLPRILQGFGITNCFLWRGVPPISSSNLFWWSGPDGSKVLVYHLARGYFQNIFHDNPTAEKLAEFLLSWASNQTFAGAHAETSGAEPISRPFPAALMPVGGDHLGAPCGFERQLDAARLLLKIETVAQTLNLQPGTEKSKDPAGSAPAVTVQATTLTAFAEIMQNYAGSKASVILETNGELRENAAARRYERAYMLPGVLSTRLYLKRLNRLAEMRLARVCEPLFTFLSICGLVEYPHAPLRLAWRNLLRNHPHDSICGCSVDAVHREMETRFEKCHAILNLLERRTFEALAGANSLPGGKDSVQSLDFTPGDDIEDGAGASATILIEPAQSQKAARKKTAAAGKSQTQAYVQPIYNVDYELSPEREVTPTKALATISQPSLADPQFAATSVILSNLCGESLIGPLSISWAEEPIAGEPALSPAANTYCDNDGTTWQIGQVSERRLIFTGTNHLPETKVVRVYDGWVWSDQIPSLGWRSFAFPNRSAWVAGSKLRRASHDDVIASDLSIANEFLTLEVAPDGLLVCTVKDAGKRARVFKLGHQFKDVGDAGDTYNFDPIEEDSPLTARLLSTELATAGPLVAALRLTYDLQIPAGMIEQAVGIDEDLPKYTRSKELSGHRFTTRVELHKSVPIVFFETTWENRARNHRLEVVFDTGLTVNKTFSENHFSIVERAVPGKKRKLPVAAGEEAELDRFPCQRFFMANRQVFFNTGLPEYAVDGANVSITLLRAVSHLSRDDLRSRSGSAGPEVVTDEANCLGANKVNYGWAPLPGENAWPQAAQVVEPMPIASEPVASEPQTILANFAKISSGQPDAVGEPESWPGSPPSSVYERFASQLPIGMTERRALDGDVINAYRLAELYETLSWSCLTDDAGSVEAVSFLQIDNPAVRVLSLRRKSEDDCVEIRLLNVLLTRQTAELQVRIPHVEAQMTTADGRILELLERVDGAFASQPEAKVEPIGQAKNRAPEDEGQLGDDMLALIESALYRLELGPNALISIRLKQNPAGVERHRSKRKGGS